MSKSHYDVIMSRKRSTFKKFRKHFKDAFLKYLVMKFHDFPFCIYPTVLN